MELSAPMIKLAIRRAVAVVALGLFAAFSIGPVAHADAIQVCAQTRQDFLEVAFPEGQMAGGRLVKWRQVPGLIVLSVGDNVGLEPEIEGAFKRIEADGVVTQFRSSFIKLTSIDEAAKLIEQQGRRNIFVFVADEANGSGELRQALQTLLMAAPLVDDVLTRARTSRGASAVDHVNIASGEVIATAMLIDPARDPGVIGHLAYAGYYASLSPGSRALGREFYEQFFSAPGARLTDFGRRYFATFLDDRVTFGLTSEAFADCKSTG